MWSVSAALILAQVFLGPRDLPPGEGPALPAEEAEEGEGSSLRISLGSRWISGHASVREWQVPGTRLGFHESLGLKLESGGQLAFAEEGASFRFEAEAEYQIGFGSRAVPETILYNGRAYPGPSRVRDQLQLLTVRSDLVFKALSLENEKTWLGPVLGFEYPYYLLSVGSNVNGNSLEDWTHYLPYPVLGAAAKTALAPGLAAEVRVTAGYVPNLPTPYREGGRLYVSARPTVFVEAPVTWTVSRSLDLSLLFAYQYWSGVDHSPEDGNLLTFSTAGVLLGVSARW